MRSLVRLLLAVVVVGIVLQCQDREGPTEVDPSGGLQIAEVPKCPTGTASPEKAICDLLDAIFEGGNQTSSFAQANNMFRQFSDKGLVEDGQAKAFALIDYLFDKHIQGKTVGTDAQVIDVMELILLYVGFTVDLSGFQFDEDAAIGFCDVNGCTLVTGNEHAGVRFPPGGLEGTILIIIENIPHEEVNGLESLVPAQANETCPLDTVFDCYPLFYEITTVPADVELNDGFFADVALCVLDDPPHEGIGAPPEVVPNLVLARPDGTCDPNGDIECLPPGASDFIDCSDLEEIPQIGLRGLLDDFTGALVSPFSPSLLHARPGETGASVSDFSPFAAVDPTSGPTCEPVSVPATAGGTVLDSEDGTAPVQTGIVVDQGDNVSIVGSGTITIFGSNPEITNGPGGFDFGGADEFNFLLSDEAAPSGESADVAGALIGRIGTGNFFYSGSSLEFTAPASGEIELAINDIESFFSDNQGEFSATVCVEDSEPPIDNF